MLWSIQREIMELSLSDSQSCSSKRNESQSKCSGHCCSIDYQWKMPDSLSWVSVFHPAAHTRRTTKLNFAPRFELICSPGCTLKLFMQQLYDLSSQQHILYAAIASKPTSNLRWKCFVAGVCRTYSIIHWADIKFESLVGYLLKSWPCPLLIKLIHGFNKWGTGGRCACRREHNSHRHPSHWSGIFGSVFVQHSHKDPCRCYWLTAQPELRVHWMQMQTHARI